jgi:hypothetical protein
MLNNFMIIGTVDKELKMILHGNGKEFDGSGMDPSRVARQVILIKNMKFL